MFASCVIKYIFFKITMNIENVSYITNAISAIAALCSSYFAFKGLTAWKRQEKSKLLIARLSELELLIDESFDLYADIVQESSEENDQKKSKEKISQLSKKIEQKINSLNYCLPGNNILQKLLGFLKNDKTPQFSKKSKELLNNLEKLQYMFMEIDNVNHKNASEIDMGSIMKVKIISAQLIESQLC